MNNSETEFEAKSAIDEPLAYAEQKVAPLGCTPEIALAQPVGSAGYSLRIERALAEAHAIIQALHKAGWNRRRAARSLGISYRALFYKISRYKITRTVGERGLQTPQNRTGTVAL